MPTPEWPIRDEPPGIDLQADPPGYDMPPQTSEATSCNLREVGVPSRNTLHGRGVGLESRIRGMRLVGIWSDLAAIQKFKF